VTLALIDGNLRREISGTLPERAPDFFFVDIQSTEVEAFTELVQAEAPEGKIVRVPMLRGRIMEFNGVDVREIDVPVEGAWVLRGDRGIHCMAAITQNLCPNCRG
ncbi:MAG: ABC transporter permease, partial [Cyanobacteria bacterium P01_E01_bin.43]